MLARLFLVFLLVPFIEVTLLIELASRIGVWETLLIQVGTAFLGASLAKYEGLRVWNNIQQRLAEGEMPTERMIDGLMVFAGGLVLLTPGLITDVLGFLLLIPVTRKLFKAWILPKFQHMSSQRQTGAVTVLLD